MCRSGYNERMKMRRNSRPWLVLKTAFTVGGMIALGVMMPVGSGEMLRLLHGKYRYRGKFQRHRLLRDLRSLQERNLVAYREQPDGTVQLTLTAPGKRFMLKYKLDDIKLNTDGPWNRQWHVVMFDIPHQYRKARDSFRRKLSQLGFYAMQKSVFITPYPCEREIEFIASIFNIRRYILIIPLGRFEGENKLIRHFDMS